MLSCTTAAIHVDFNTKGAVNISKPHYSLLYDIFSTHIDIDGTESKFSNDLPRHNNNSYHLVVQFARFWFKTKNIHRESATQQMSTSSTTTTTTTKTKPVIGVDVDDVLTPLISHLLEFYNRKYDAQIRFEDFLSFRYHEVWGRTEEDTHKIVDEFLSSPEFLNQKPMPYSQQVLQTLKKDYDFVVVTSRHHFLRSHTQQFLDVYFPGIFTELKMGNYFAQDGVKKSKTDLCKESDVCLLIDDCVDYVQHAASHNIKAILFGEYPWNKCDKLHASVRRVKSWTEVPVALYELLGSINKE
jgi:5'(3')-deoxyribonucleotidase